MTDEKYMELAYKQAKLAYAQGEVPVGAIIVLNNRVIASAHNQKDSSKCVTKHAELIAIEQASLLLDNWRLVDCSMYVTLEPCPMCASAIQQARISKVYIGCKSAFQQNTAIVDNIFNSINANRKVLKYGPILEERCSSLLKKFFSERRG